MNQGIRILVVEDETMIAEDIALRLMELGYKIAGNVSMVDQAIEILNKKDTDLALLDINLKGEKDGIELAHYINKNIHIPFIFLTSIANKPILERAKEVNPSAFLLKPFNDRQIQFSIEIALVNYANRYEKDLSIKLDSVIEEKDTILRFPNSLFLKKDFQFIRVDYNDILWLEAESNYTMIYTRKGKFMYSSVLKSFEKKLPDSQFMRVHRSYIVNIENVTGFEGNILFVGDKRIPVGKSNREIIFNKFRIM